MSDWILDVLAYLGVDGILVVLTVFILLVGWLRDVSSSGFDQEGV